MTDHKTSHNKKFAFDFVYDENTKQETVHMRCLWQHSARKDRLHTTLNLALQVYQDLGAPMLDKAFAGFNATIFAYGQVCTCSSLNNSQLLVLITHVFYRMVVDVCRLVAARRIACLALRGFRASSHA